MPDQNTIYDFMKSNKLTDLDEKTFVSKYSAPDKAKEIHSFFVENNLTDLDETKFYDKYLKKKVGSEESSLTELPLQGFSKEQIDLLQKGVEPPKPSGKAGAGLVIPTNIARDQIAYERELKRNDAAINTLKNTYKQKAKVRGMRSAAEALKAIAGSGASFVSRGDKSGTNTKELAVWASLGEQGYSGVMAATGLSYLATLTATGAAVVGRLLVDGPVLS